VRVLTNVCVLHQNICFVVCRPVVGLHPPTGYSQAHSHQGAGWGSPSWHAPTPAHGHPGHKDDVKDKSESAAQEDDKVCMFIWLQDLPFAVVCHRLCNNPDQVQ